MPTLSLFDNRTLFASNCMLAAVFALLFMGVRRVFPYVRGTRSIALSYLLTIPACLLLAARGAIPYVVSVVLANVFVLGSFIAMYDGIARFCRVRLLTSQLVVLTSVTIGGVLFFTVIRDRMELRMLLVGALTALIRALSGYALCTKSAIPANRRVMRLFGGFLLALAATGLLRSLVVGFFGASQEFLRGDDSLTVSLGVTLLYLSVSGVCFLLLASSELVTATRLESERDLVTGTLNRRGIEDRLRKEMERAHSKPLSICLLDVDRFKPINDTLGHNAGDRALRLLAEEISACVRGSDHVGRYGGDEFLVVLPETTADEIYGFTKRLRQAIDRMPELDGMHKLSLSMGVAEASEDDTGASLIARADAALYRDKRDRREEEEMRAAFRLEVAGLSQIGSLGEGLES